MTYNLKWIGNSLWMGKICVGYLEEHTGYWTVMWPDDYRMDNFEDYFVVEFTTFTGTEPEARAFLESFVREQMGLGN